MNYYPEVEKYPSYPLKRNLEKKGVSMRKLAEKIGADYSYLYRLEQGMFIASYEMAQKIIKGVESF